MIKFIYNVLPVLVTYVDGDKEDLQGFAGFIADRYHLDVDRDAVRRRLLNSAARYQS